MIRLNSLERTAFVSIIALSSSSTPASPMAARKRPNQVANDGAVRPKAGNGRRAVRAAVGKTHERWHPPMVPRQTIQWGRGAKGSRRFMMCTLTLLRSQGCKRGATEQLLPTLNRLLVEDNETEMFAPSALSLFRCVTYG
jgi:hypothetical protein